MSDPSPPELARVDTAALDVLRSLLPGLGGEQDGRTDDGASVSSASLYFSAAGDSPSPSPRAWLVGGEASLAHELPALVESLEAGEDQESLCQSLSSLAALIDTSFGDAASAICAMMRSCDAVAKLVRLLEHDAPTVHQHALVLLGNLASYDVDPVGAKQARRQLREVDGFQKLLPHLDSSDHMTLVYALGAIQNTCCEIEYVYAMQQQGLIGRLQRFVASGDEHLETFARGCLANMRETILYAVSTRRKAAEHSL
jgi:hypothetical protein